MILLLIYLGIALVFSFLCSVAEAVLLSVNRGYIEALRVSKPGAANHLRRFRNNPEVPLSAILTLNTIAHTVGAAGVGHQAAVVFGDQWLGVSSAVLTLLILIGSEIIPKTLGATHWRKLAPITAYGIRLLVVLLHPFIVVLRGITNRISHAETEERSLDEIQSTIDLTRRSEHLSALESKLLGNILSLRNTHVREIMTPRVIVFAVPGTTSVQEFLKSHTASPFSRIPLFGENIDDITGYVLRSAILEAKDSDQPLSDWKRDLVTLFETASVSHAYQTMIEGNHHIAVVTNEFGGTAGILTLEDILETLVGHEIIDELDPAANLRQEARIKNQRRISASDQAQS